MEYVLKGQKPHNHNVPVSNAGRYDCVLLSVTWCGVADDVRTTNRSKNRKCGNNPCTSTEEIRTLIQTGDLETTKCIKGIRLITEKVNESRDEQFPLAA
jgi:hypothetical protein